VMRVSKNEESSLGLVRQNQRGNERAEGGATPPNSNTLGGIRKKQTKHRKSKSGFSVPCFSPGVRERSVCELCPFNAKRASIKAKSDNSKLNSLTKCHRKFLLFLTWMIVHLCVDHFTFLISLTAGIFKQTNTFKIKHLEIRLQDTL
jgi:hypothetical protein